MQFNVKEWRVFYDRINKMGQMLKDSYPTIDEHGIKHPPKKALRTLKQESLKEEIKKQTEKCVRYLDWCGKRLPSPSWLYNIGDKTTWKSDESFKYGHLVKTDKRNLQ